MKRRTKPAFSLMEMMVSLALVGMMMTSLAVIVQAAVRYYTTSNLICEVQQATLTASTALTIDLCESTSASIAPTAFGPTQWMVMASPRAEYTGKTTTYENAVTGNYALYWATLVGYYIDGSHNLVRKIQGIANTPVAPSATTFPAQYSGSFFQTLSTGDYRTVSPDISYVELDPDPAASSLMWLGVYGQDSGGVYLLNVVTQVSPRN